MLDLRSIPDEEFSIVVTTSAPQTATHIKIEESGKVILSSKVAERFAKKSVHLRFNKDFTAIQLAQLTAEADLNSIVFPKNGRKTLWDAVALLKQNRIPFPAVYQGYYLESGKWRGERQQNPTVKSSASTRKTKRK